MSSPPANPHLTDANLAAANLQDQILEAEEVDNQVAAIDAVVNVPPRVCHKPTHGN